jgi:polar amino acid transport system substrate-binding protein
MQILRALFPDRLQRAIALFLASLLLTISIASCSSGPAPSAKKLAVIPGKSLDKIMADKTLRVAVPDDFPPFGSVGPDMKLRGYDIDVAGEVAKEIGVKLQLVPVIGNYRIPFLQTDRVDVVVSSLGKNKDRAKIIDFSKPYAPFFSGVYGGSDIKVASMDDLKGRTIGVAQGSLEDLEISKQPAGNMQIRRFASNSLTASALVSGQVELIATGNVVANKLMRDNPDKKIEKKIIMKDSPCYIGIRKGDTKLVERVDGVIANLVQSGKLNELSLKWLGEPLPPKFAA